MSSLPAFATEGPYADAWDKSRRSYEGLVLLCLKSQSTATLIGDGTSVNTVKVFYGPKSIALTETTDGLDVWPETEASNGVRGFLMLTNCTQNFLTRLQQSLDDGPPGMMMDIDPPGFPIKARSVDSCARLSANILRKAKNQSGENFSFDVPQGASAQAGSSSTTTEPHSSIFLSSARTSHKDRVRSLKDITALAQEHYNASEPGKTRGQALS